jgi:large subunit ribosomal protein L32
MTHSLFRLQIIEISIKLRTDVEKDYKMAVPKKKTSKAKSAMRRSHNALPTMPAGSCKKCGEKKRPHHVCAACGAYDDKQVVSK